MSRKFFVVLALLWGALACGVAAAQSAGVNRDPFEGFNRVMYRFNTELDRIVLKPVAENYVKFVPEPARNCVGNVFGNLSDVGTALNNALQGKIVDALSDLCRVAINSTLGIFGCFDVASEMGFVKHREDFGQTLAVWGVKPGPYLMLPFLGPSSLRDSLGLFTVDSRLDVVRNLDHVATRNQLFGLRLVDQRAGLLYASSIIDNASLDPYVFVRDAYFQRRNSQVYDGDPPDDEKPAGGAGSGAPADAAAIFPDLYQVGAN